jgi:hypothetical protein
MLFESAKKNPHLRLEILGTDSSIELNQVHKYIRNTVSETIIKNLSFCGEMPKPVITKSAFATKNIWVISAIVSLAVRNDFELAIRKTPDFVLNDMFESVVEPVVTRVKAIEDVLIQSSGFIEYFAKFLIRVDANSIQQQSLRDGVLLNFTMNELQRLTV